jgi:hypothetical protein
MAKFRMAMRGGLEFIADRYGGPQWVELTESVRLSYRKSLFRDWLRIKEMELHGAGMATLESWFVRADRAIKLGEVPELLCLLRMIEDKVNQEGDWQRGDKETAFDLYPRRS